MSRKDPSCPQLTSGRNIWKWVIWAIYSRSPVLQPRDRCWNEEFVLNTYHRTLSQLSESRSRSPCHNEDLSPHRSWCARPQSELVRCAPKGQFTAESSKTTRAQLMCLQTGAEVALCHAHSTTGIRSQLPSSSTCPEHTQLTPWHPGRALHRSSPDLPPLCLSTVTSHSSLCSNDGIFQK